MTAQAVKAVVYRLLVQTPASVLAQDVFSPLIRLPFLDVQGLPEVRPFSIALTIDTESGYVIPSGRRVWMTEAPRAFVGYEHGIANWRTLAQRAGIRVTFLLSTQCFAATGKEYRGVCDQLTAALAEGHELGLHLHPQEDEVLGHELKRHFSWTGSIYYSREEIENMLNAGRRLIARHLGNDVADRVNSFRWANWALSTPAVAALHNTGFTVDSSACPGLAGHLKGTSIDRAYDWRRVETQHPWWLNPRDYQETNGRESEVLELPVTVFALLNARYRADPCWGMILLRVIRKFYRKVQQGASPFVFVILSHSSEGTLIDGRQSSLLAVLERVIGAVKSLPDVTFVTLQKARQQVLTLGGNSG